MRVWYLPLESYRERYTEQLFTWTTEALTRRGIEYIAIAGNPLSEHRTIKTGPVLDAYGRSYYALTQMANLVKYADRIKVDDWIYFDDMFTPGFEALPYIFDQTDVWPSLAVRNWAQSMDVDDFTFKMQRWMRHYELMVECAGKRLPEPRVHMFVGSTCHKEMCRAAGFTLPIHVVGLQFDQAEVRSRHPDPIPAWHRRPKRVVYTSRLDAEKQPHFFMDVVEAFRAQGHDDTDIVVCTGSDEPRSNDPSALSRLADCERRGLLRVAKGLSKAEYYAILATARVQLNTARQDFVSFTALEASAFGTVTLAPAFRSFPEALFNRRSQLYVPWSPQDCIERLTTLLSKGEAGVSDLAEHHSRTMDRTIDVMLEA